MSITNNMHLSDNYKLLDKIGSGSFGEVYLTVDNKGKQNAAKVEEKKSNSRLRDEYDIYKKLYKRGIKKGIPKVVTFIETQLYNVMIMQLLGDSLESRFNNNGKKFKLCTIYKIAIDMITLVETLHSGGYIHRDIKPNNFLFNYGNMPETLYIMDFGLSKSYLTKSKEHIEFRYDRSLVGTARYTSTNIHMGMEPSRRDDLESIIYILLYFLKGTLPWQGLKKDKYHTQIEKIGQVKMCIKLEDLCMDLPKCLLESLVYCRNLEFNETPDYEKLKNMFLRDAKESNTEINYEWIV